jgi:hypothetical protein
VHADEKLTAFLELESAIRARSKPQFEKINVRLVAYSSVLSWPGAARIVRASNSLKSPRAQMKLSEIRTFSVICCNPLGWLLLYPVPKALLGELSKSLTSKPR